MSGWGTVSAFLHLAGACGAALAATVVLRRQRRFGVAGQALAAMLGLTASWSIAVAALGEAALATQLGEALRNLAFLFALYRLFACDGRHASVAPVRPLLAALAFVEVVLATLLIAAPSAARTGLSGQLLFEMTALFRLLVAVGGLVLVHNLYLGAASSARAVLRWPAMAIAGVWGFELNLYAVAYMAAEWPAEIGAIRALPILAMAGLIALGGVGARADLPLRPSRAVTFRTASLLLIGVYLGGLMALAKWLAMAGGDFAGLLQSVLLVAGTVLAVALLPSPRLRGWLRVMLAKHLFQHRYDYREEWLRFTRTVGQAGESRSPLEERAIRALADIADSPSGLLLSRDASGSLVLTARWQWPTAGVPLPALDESAASFLARGHFIVDLEDVRAGRARHGEGAVIPDWLREEPRAWALVPLVHYDRLVGAVVLARPPHGRRLDWEDFDLLRIAGQQLASYLAEQAGQQALDEAQRFEDFHRRIAFVMHDIKNLASQFTLLARNAEKHAENPAFRADMIGTLRNSADKLNTLIARLSRYGSSVVGPLRSVSADAVAGQVVAHFSQRHPVMLAHAAPCAVVADAEALEQVLAHLVQNAIDASDAASPVVVSVSVDDSGARQGARIEVIDAGGGMTAEFLGSGLFRPFVSSKPGGFGIGAYEARELVHAMGGRLEVESRLGVGTRFVIWLDRAAPDRLQAEQAPDTDPHQTVTVRKVA